MMSERSALNTVLSGLFDYAGTFPPARLELNQAVAEALSFESTLKRPFLVNNRGVFNSSELTDVAAILNTAGVANKPFEFSALLIAGDELDRAVTELCNVLGENPFLKMTGIELKIGSPLELEQAGKLLGLFSGIRLFLEPSREIREQAIAYIDQLGAKNHAIGLKVRAAGPTAVSTAELANIIKDLTDRGIPLKVTQGLHSPFIQGNAPTGFLTLALATYLSKAGASVGQIEQILRLTDLTPFSYDEGTGSYISFDRVTIELKRCIELNHLGIIRIGSCSIREPDEELDRLGL